MAKHNETGAWGEEVVANFLQQQGYLLRDKNYRFLKGEIDLVMETPDEIVFVEVKTRLGSADDQEEMVSKSKQKLLIETAHQYIVQHDIDKNARFDFAIVEGENNPKISYFEGAFYPNA